MAAVDVLKELGFKEQSVDKFQKLADDLGMSDTADGKPYTVLNVLIRDDVTALIEKNVSEDNANGLDTITKHPAVLILESPRGRVCVPNHDVDENAQLIKSVVGDLAAGKD